MTGKAERVSDPTAGGSRELPPELDPRGRGSRGVAGTTVMPGRTGRGRLAARVLSWVAVVTSVAVLLASGTAFVLFRSFSGNLERIDVFAQAGGEDERPDASQEAENFLLVGSDTREGATQEELAAANTEYEAGQRSDTTMLLHIPPGQDKALVVSIPRDAFVDIPAYTVPETGERLPATSDKFNEAYATGGPGRAIKTVERLTGVRIDHYLEVDFTGFRRMVDALDYVEVCVPAPAKDAFSGLDLPAGTSRVDGEQALAFVRARHVFGGNDFDRIGRQQQFLAAMMNRITSMGVLGRPDRLLDFLGVVGDSVTADQEFGFDEMRTLALRLRNLDPARVHFVTLPVADVDWTPPGYRGSYVQIDEQAARELFRLIRTESYFDEAEQEAEPPPTVDPATVRVQVLNAAGVAGLGRQVSDRLAAAGFQVGTPGNAERSGAPASVVRHAPGDEAAANTVAAAVPGATPRVDESLDPGQVVLEVGSSYAPPAPATEPAPAPEAAPPGLSPRTAADDPCASAPGAQA